MRDCIIELLNHLVDNPDKTNLNQKEDDDKIIFTVQAAKDDIGKIIGRNGKHAMALRTLLSAVAAKEGKRAILEVAD